MARRDWLLVHPDLRAARVAAAQSAVIDRGQLRIVGFSRGAIEHRVRTGRLHRLHRGVFAWGRGDLGPLGREIAALLACGPSAVLSHRSAAALWGLAPPAFGPVDIAVRGNAGRGREGITNHRLDLQPQDIRVRAGLRITSPARTIVSLTDVVTLTDLEHMAGMAIRKDLTTIDELRSKATGRLKRVLDAEPEFTRSEAERRFLDLIRRAKLPPPQVNRLMAGHEVDFAWPDRRLVVEVDGYAFHSTKREIENDRHREADLDCQGFDVLRFTWRQITEEPEQLLVRLARRLSG